ncbi:MAG: prolipoprotein diacylglyceryl transferase [Candidatus Dadabacteria bacterium]|nr:prolipoprotein diacylglyceryl transferase [Candidatus Dadabacteria bacterium]
MHYLLLRGGLTFYGGFFLALFAFFVLTKKHKESFWKVLDATAPALAIAYATGRVGCLLVGDDYGVASTLPWAMPFPKGSPPTLEAVHPTQIYETIIMSLVFLVLWKIRKKDKPVGWLASIYLGLAGLERFFVEFIRNTTESPISGLSVAQVMALALILIGALKYISLRRHKEAF